MRISRAVICIASLAAAASGLIAASADAANHNPVVVIQTSELEPALASQIMQAQTPVIIDFKVTPQTTAEAQECSAQDAVTATIAQEFAGKVTVLTADAAAQDSNMVARARIAVCPTHLLVLTRDAQTGTITAFRRWGYMNRPQFEQLIEEEFGVMP